MDYEAGEAQQEINHILAERITMKDTAAMEYVMSNPDGRWFVSRLLENCHVDSMLGLMRADGCMVMDPNAMMVQEGGRRVGLVLKNNILSMPGGLTLYHAMEQERKEYAQQQEEIKRSIVERYEE